MSSSSTITLADRMNDLPFELWKMIYDATFTQSRPCMATDMSEWSIFQEPCPLLAVDRRSRALFAESYYTETLFIHDCHNRMRRWMASLPKEHRSLLRMVWFISKNTCASLRAHLLLCEMKVPGFIMPPRMVCDSLCCDSWVELGS
jgi:hypothetical protein